LKNTIRLPQYIWQESKEVDFPLPDSWQVTVHNVAGYDKPALKAGEIKAAEFNMALPGLQALKPEGGSIVIIASSPSGQVVHYLFDNFGRTIGGSISHPMPVPPHVEKIIIYNEYPEARVPGRFANPEKVLQTSDWKQVIETLTKAHGESARVAVYPNADTQFFAD